jgi:tetratricopeptide (TPR) repeat protein
MFRTATIFATALVVLLLADTTVIGAEQSVVDEGIAAFRDGKYSVALDKLQKAVKLGPRDDRAFVYLALTQAARNDCRSALPTLKAHLEVTDPTMARMTGIAAAKCEQTMGNDAGALAVLSNLQHRFPADADIIYGVARFHMKAFNDATFTMFQKTPGSYRVHELSAEIFEVQGRFDEAVDEYRKAINMNSSAPDLHYRLGRAILMKSHDPEALAQAQSEFTNELKLSPEDSACEFQLGQIAQVQNKFDEAKRHFERALSISPDFPEALIALGKLQGQAKQYGESIALFEKALKLQPSNEAAHYALMIAYRNSGQIEKARAEKATLDQLQKRPSGEFTEFLKKLGEKPPEQ